MSWQPPALPPGALARLAAARVLILGLGGLGGHVALLLVRSGVGQLVLVDGDRVEASNLSRQPYFSSQVGWWKTEAMATLLRQIRPHIGLTLVPRYAAPADLPSLAQGCGCVVEAVDGAETKAGLVEAALREGYAVVSASGIGGLGGTLAVRRLGRLVVVGDETTPCAGGTPPLAPRVTAAAALQADAALAFILQPPEGQWAGDQHKRAGQCG